MDSQTSPKKGLWIAFAVVVLGALIYWYYLSPATPAVTPSAADQVQTPSLSSGNTTADIQNDLNATPNAGAALNQDKASASASINSL